MRINTAMSCDMDNKISIDPRLTARLTKYPDRLTAIERDYNKAAQLMSSYEVDEQGQLSREIERFTTRLREYHLALYLCIEQANALCIDLHKELAYLSKKPDCNLVFNTKATLETELAVLRALRAQMEDSLAFAKQARKNLKTIKETCNLAALIRLCKSWSDYATESRMK